MEFLRRTIKQIKAQLGGLTLSQRLVIFLLVVIMGGAVYWMVEHASRQEMIPLMNQPFTPEEINKITQQLDFWEVQYKVDSDRIMVPRTEQRGLIYRLSGQDMLTGDKSAGWESLLEDSNIWESESHRADQKRVILQMELSRALVKGWPEIEKAQVFINEAGERRVSNITPVASASVMVQVNSDARPARKLALSIADFVSAANRRMKREDVKVIVNGQSIPVAPAGEGISSDYLEEKAKYETHYITKLTAIMPDKSRVQVDVTPQLSKTTRHETKIANPEEGTVVVAARSSTSEETSKNQTVSQEPGVSANVSAPDAQSGVASSESREDQEQENTVIPGKTEITEITGQGGVKDITATVSIPRAYFEGLAKQESGQDKPDDALVKSIMTRELPGFKQKVMLAVGLQGAADADKVVVDAYWDEEYVAQAGVDATEVNQAGGGGGFVGIARRYGEHIAVSALALVSLFMVLMMARKTSAPVEMDEEDAAMLVGKKPMSALGVEEGLIDGADAGALLAGMEMDDEDVQTQQMLEQIKEMVTDSPDTAATLVNNWIHQGD